MTWRSGMARILKRSQFYLHAQHTSTNGMKYILPLPLHYHM